MFESKNVVTLVGKVGKGKSLFADEYVTLVDKECDNKKINDTLRTHITLTWVFRSLVALFLVWLVVDEIKCSNSESDSEKDEDVCDCSIICVCGYDNDDEDDVEPDCCGNGCK